MSPFSSLHTQSASTSPFKLGIIQVVEGACAQKEKLQSLSLAGLLAPFVLVEQSLGAARFELTLHQVEINAPNEPVSAILLPNFHQYHLVLLVADTGRTSPNAQQIRQLTQHIQQAHNWGAVGVAVLWLANAGKMQGLRTALPWASYANINELAEHAILMPNLFEQDGRCFTCCGGAASIDFALTLINAVFGTPVQANVMEALCIERVRSGDERQRIALQTRFGVLQPHLSEAVTLMENNIEEPLSTDEIAQLVGISRRQLERQFKQYLGTMPSRYYLELRLKKARQYLLESNTSIVQIGLMFGFSSGAHFSTAFGAEFGITPREERQKKLKGQ